MQKERKKETKTNNKLQPMMLNPAGFSFRIQEEKIYLLRQEKQQEFINSKPILKEISKDLYVKKKKKKKKIEKATIR